MNLLPRKLIQRRQIHTEIKRLAAIQAVIFLLIILLVGVFELFIELRNTQIEEIAIHITDEKFAKSEAIAQEIRNFHTRIANEQVAIEWLELPIFDINRLDMILETLPQGVTLLRIDIDEQRGIVTALTDDLSLSDNHRYAWMSTGLVSRTQLISAIAVEERMIQYVLALHWVDDE